MQTIATTATSNPSSRDERTTYAAGLDMAAAWLADRLPDRVPQGTPLLLITTSGHLATLAVELARRYHHRYHGLPDYQGLRTCMDGLPRLLRDVTLTADRVRVALDQVDEFVERFERPAAPPPPVPALVLELARDLAVELREDLDVAAARAELARVAAERNTGDRRAAPLWSRLFATANGDVGVGAGLGAFSADQLTRWRHALVGYGLPKVRADDRVFGRAPRTVLAPPRPEVFGNIVDRAQMPVALEALKRLAADLGITLPRPEQGEADAEKRANAAWAHNRRREIEAKAREATRAARTPGERSAAADTAGPALAEVDRELAERQRAISDRQQAARRGPCLELVAAIDVRIDATPPAAVGSLGFYWLRELRRHLACSTDDRPEVRGVAFVGANADDDFAAVCDLCRSLGALA